MIKPKFFKKTFCALLFILLSVMPVYAQNNEKNIIDGLNSFAFDFNKNVTVTSQNLIHSPYSLSSVLAILTMGASGETRTQLIKALNLPAEQNNLLLTNPLQQNPQLIIANALWAQQGLQYKKDFLQQLKTNNTVDFQQLDFSNSAQAAATVNHWVSQKTNGKIENLIQSSMLNASTRLVLTNAIYFKGNWKFQFDLKRTATKPFIAASGNKINVAMMQQQHSFLYNENNELQMLQLPYADSDLAMVILLPKPAYSLEKLQHSLSYKMFGNLISGAHYEDVNVWLPKFKIASTMNNLTEVLQKLGIVDAFSPRANFFNLAAEPIYLSSVIQKAMIEVDEKGTTAAAATAGVMMRASITEPKPPKEFHADHPFMFAIYDAKNKIILFMGQVVNPNA